MVFTHLKKGFLKCVKYATVSGMEQKETTKKLEPQVLDVSMSELLEIVERTKEAPLGEKDHSMLTAAMTTLSVLMEELKKNKVSIQRLQQMLFGASTEKTSNVLKEDDKSPNSSEESSSASDVNKDTKRPGHGRRPAAAYTGAERKRVPHPSLHSGECCPGCQSGKVYLLKPATLIRITGMAPLGATVWECERLRCNLCGEVFKANAPEGVGDEKYDETATSMVAQLKYGSGLPFHRIEKLQEGMGIPLPAANQWTLVKEGAHALDCEEPQNLMDLGTC